jgi:hypothetical protein
MVAVKVQKHLLSTVDEIVCEHRLSLVLQEAILNEESRRKLAVHIVASPKAVAAASSAAEETAADKASNGSSAEPNAIEPLTNGAVSTAAQEADREPKLAQTVRSDKVTAVTKKAATIQVIKDVWAFKRAQEMYPSSK